jgi:sugar lactone lactonase YvrE
VRNAVGESPVWRAAEQALYWVDIPERRLHRWQAAGDKVELEMAASSSRWSRD